VFMLEQKLAGKGFAPEEIKETVSKLIAWKYLDDQSYAQALIRRKREKVSPAKLFYELTKDGVDRELSCRLLQEDYPQELVYRNCLQAANRLWLEERRKWEKKYGRDPKYRDAAAENFLRQKVGKKLMLKGFDSQTITKVLRNHY